ncbi:hypothetical protein [Bordetella bronchiseptica]|uniref:Uncharacterized protein n=1 Tax=Bordetella bronchiseptica (strain ATCC BAA-588 / NCTC 13252 / RB50) TaxID=257310 RepID=A0A0H3LLF7_BORBR|nr:hypothetical protein [Bordetella bronchiseptica]AMG88071.1 hypothetical protein AL472_09880 [Bordetella bronchiseptica]CAE32181.1 phage-related hypothetical protein [Bordetella bronchiseptica RB50]
MIPQPRIKPVGGRQWECACQFVRRRGSSQKQAYDRWLVASIRHAMAPAKVPAEPKRKKAVKSEKRKTKVTQDVPGVLVHRIEDQPASSDSHAGQGSIPVKPARPKPAPYIGVAAGPRNFVKTGQYTMSPEMRLAHARAAAAQGAMHAMAPSRPDQRGLR